MLWEATEKADAAERKKHMASISPAERVEKRPGQDERGVTVEKKKPRAKSAGSMKECPICHQTFARNMKRHKDTHKADVEPIPCPEFGCSSKFTRPDNLKAHLMIYHKK
jgi:hypothetical protein